MSPGHDEGCGSTMSGRPVLTEFAGDNVNPTPRCQSTCRAGEGPNLRLRSVHLVVWNSS